MSTRRAQHLVFMAHVWACVPFLVLWIFDLRAQRVLGPEARSALIGVICVTIVYLAARTVVAYRDWGRLSWQYIFPPIDVGLIALILFLSHRGPTSNVTLLFFLPMIQASGSLNVRWAACVGLMVVLGTAISTIGPVDVPAEHVLRSARELIREDPLNSFFRIYFLVVLASLMTYQAQIAAGLRERLGVAADRNRIALEMHDGVQGHLVSLAWQLDLMARVAEQDGPRAVEIATESRETVRQAADELRFLVQRLRSPSLENGFVSALRQFTHNICERYALALDFQIVGTEVALDPEIENALFRIAQETLTNVVKHAQATALTVRMAYDPGKVSLVIADNGVGFRESPEAAGVGLVSMRERAAKLGGSAQVLSEPSKGATVAVHLPATPI